MKGKNAFDAIEGIDTRYILEAAPDAPAHRGSKLRYIRIGAVAASLAVVTAAVLLGVGSLRESGESPAVPPAGGTGELETPTGGENAPLPPLNGSYTTDLYTVEEIDRRYANLARVRTTKTGYEFFDERIPIEIVATIKDCGFYFATAVEGDRVYFVSTKDTESFGELSMDFYDPDEVNERLLKIFQK